MSQNEPKKPLEKKILGKRIRRRKVFELLGEGKTIDEIAAALGVSNSTVDRDLKSADLSALTDELVRRQIADIESAKLPMRLSFRGDLLAKLLPKKMEQKIEGGESFRVEIVDNSKESKDNKVSSASGAA